MAIGSLTPLMNPGNKKVYMTSFPHCPSFDRKPSMDWGICHESQAGSQTPREICQVSSGGRPPGKTALGSSSVRILGCAAN
jgi:hypothetical protein